MIDSIRTVLTSYRSIAEKALAQISEAGLNRIPHPDGNSPAMQVRHVSGNLISRLTNFLTEDGEKPWRNRESEFDERAYTREEVEEMWDRAWAVVERTLSELTDDDLSRNVRLRGKDVTAGEALLRVLAHVSYHVGQIVLLARTDAVESWEWISIPKGQSEAFNREMMGGGAG